MGNGCNGFIVCNLKNINEFIHIFSIFFSNYLFLQYFLKSFLVEDVLKTNQSVSM